MESLFSASDELRLMTRLPGVRDCDGEDMVEMGGTLRAVEGCR